MYGIKNKRRGHMKMGQHIGSNCRTSDPLRVVENLEGLNPLGNGVKGKFIHGGLYKRTIHRNDTKLNIYILFRTIDKIKRRNVLDVAPIDKKFQNLVIHCF
jgi:hypothetical protein